MKYCPECGNKLDGGEKFCPECGQSLKKNVERKTEANDEQGSKELPASKIFGILAGLIVVVFIILAMSGVFESTEAPPTNNNTTNTNVAEHNHPTDPSQVPDIAKIQGMLAEDPGNAALLLQYANLLNDHGFFIKAIEAYENYLQIMPDVPEAIIDMGVCYFELRNFAAADSVMRMALEINPNHLIGNFNLGIVNYNAGNLERSKQYFNKVISLQPQSQQAQIAREILNEIKNAQ